MGIQEKKVAKAYKKIQSSEHKYQAFTYIDQLHPEIAKQVLIKYVINALKSGEDHE